MDERFQELLPWYVNGTLGDAERAWVERHLAEHPEARAELEWYRSLQTRMRENAPKVPATIGLAKVMQLIQADRPTLLERCTALLDRLGMRPGAALAALAVVAVQGAFILNLSGHVSEDEAQIRAIKATRVEEGPLLKLNFAPEAKEADIRFLLISIQGTLAGGPGQLGDYFVRVPADREAASVERLKNHPLVQSVVLAPGLPPRE